MTEKDLVKISNACDVLCSYCDLKGMCDSCTVTEIYRRAADSIDTDEPTLFDEDDIDESNFIDPNYDDYDSSCGV